MEKRFNTHRDTTPYHNLLQRPVMCRADFRGGMAHRLLHGAHAVGDETTSSR